MKREKRFLGVFALILLVLSGGWFAGSRPLLAETSESSEAGNSSPVQNDAGKLSYQEYASILAGTHIAPSILVNHVNPEGWYDYAEDMASIWHRFKQKNLEPMRDWATRELGPSQTAGGTVFYPFSGPDVVNMLAFFPQAKTYLLIALEPVGTLPVLRPGQNEPFFIGLEQSLHELLQFNFFFTKMMEKNLIQREFNGVLPVLLFFLAREQVRFLEVKYWLLQPDGNITETPVQAGEKPGGEGIPGVKIVFQRQEGEPEQTLYYFQFNLLNSFWQKHPNFVNIRPTR